MFKGMWLWEKGSKGLCDFHIQIVLIRWSSSGNIIGVCLWSPIYEGITPVAPFTNMV